MKRLFIGLSALLTGLTAGATETASVDCVNVFGILRVVSPATRTLVAIPWCECDGQNNQPICVSNIVKTANLTAGDTIHVMNDSGEAFHTWQLTRNGDVLTWVSVNQVSTNGVVTQTESSSDVTVRRGNALMLMRHGDLSQPFYLYGQVGTNSTITTTDILAGAADAPKYSLISSARDEDWGVNSDVEWSDVGANDQLSVYKNNGQNIFLSYKDGKWGVNEDVYTVHPVLGKIKTGTQFVQYNDKIRAGTGCWYISYGGAPTLTWTNIPTK